jgi:hypothetical protein
VILSGRRLGSLWRRREAGKGAAVLTGVVNLPDGSTVRVGLFKAMRKRRESSPDFVLYVMPEATPVRREEAA